ncbi:MAG: hypothetical protein ACT4NY_16120 [Pseudonocardiales bacterium]
MRSGRWRAVVAVLLAGLVASCAGEASVAAPAALPANLAFIDVEATAAVSDEIAPAVARFFSYDFRQLDEHSAQIMADSTAAYWAQVEPTLEVVRSVATSRQVATTSEVVATSVRVLEPSRAELLLFVNRSTTQADAPAQREPSSIIVTAAQIGPNWKIDAMTVDGSAQPVPENTTTERSDAIATAERRDAAVQAAEQTAVALTSLDHRDPDAGYDRLLDLLTGPARQEWEQRRAEYLAPITSDVVTVERPAVTASGVAALDPAGTAATVLVSAVAEVSTNQAPTPKKRFSRLQMSLVQTGAEWKVSQLRFVP